MANNTLELFHGSEARGILGIINDGAIKPDSQNHVYFTYQFSDALQHGADREARASFAFKAIVTVIPGASVSRVAKNGNPLTTLITTTLPLPIKILELYIRTGTPGEFEINVVKGEMSIKARLISLLNNSGRK